jgi:hypothetical protein
MNKITINGKTITHSGRGSVCISNNKVTIGGVDIKDLDTIEEKTINIVIEGNVENIMTEDAGITVGTATTKNGNISCHDVSGDVETKNGNIMCGSVQGDATTKNGNIMGGR